MAGTTLLTNRYRHFMRPAALLGLESLEQRLLLNADLVSKAIGGGTGNGHSELTAYFGESLSADGRYLVFESYASDLLPSGIDTNGTADVFRYDRQTDSVELVSVALDGKAGSRRSSQPTISDDGRFVAFASLATNLVTSPIQTQNIFVRDMTLGQTILVSIAEAGGQGGNGHSYVPIISGDGTTVAFRSYATNLSSLDNNSRSDVYARRLAESTVRLVSKPEPGQESNANYASYPTGISADGNSIVFQHWGTNLFSNDYNNTLDVFLGSLVNESVTLVSRSTSGATGDHHSTNGQIAGDATKVVFESRATDLVEQDGNGPNSDVFAYDIASGSISLVSLSEIGEAANGGSYLPRVNADGTVVAFQSYASNLDGDSADNNGRHDVYRKRLTTGAIDLVSVTPDGKAGNGESYQLRMSNDGEVVAFHSRATNLVPNRPKSAVHNDAFVHDFSRDTLAMASSPSSGTEAANGSSWIRGLSGDGRTLGFYSLASNIVANDNNGTWDVFVFKGTDEDFGDAPTTYPVELASNGARHDTVGPRLGANRDAEPEGLSSTDADGDDNGASPNDEDGISFGPIVAGITSSVTVNVQDGSTGAMLDAWIDFDGNASWDVTDQIATSLAVSEGDNEVSFFVPADAVTSSPSYARFRLSSAGSLSPTGPAADGEVEDYKVEIIGEPTLGFSSDVVVQEGSIGTNIASVVVDRSHNYTDVQFDFATIAGTASIDTDFVETSGTILLPAGGPLSRSIPIELIGDITLEDDESFTVLLSNPVNATFASSVANVEIANDDTASVTITPVMSNQEEGTFASTTSYELSLELSDAVQGGLQVTVTTEDGTATLVDGDYNPLDQTVSFVGFEGEIRSVTAEVVHDSTKEDDENFSVRLSSPLTPWSDATAVFFPGNPAVLTIENDDMIPPVADAGGLYGVVSGTSVTFDASGTFDADGIASYEWDLDNDGDFDDASGEFAFKSSGDLTTLGLTDGNYPISLLVTDNTGITDTDQTTLFISPNLLPIAEANGPYTLDGPMRELMISSAGSMDPDGDDMFLIPEWDLNNDGVYGDIVGDALGGMAMMPLEELQLYGFDEPGAYPISLRVIDEAGGPGFDSTTLTITNIEPSLSPLEFLPPAEPGFDFSVFALAEDLDDDAARLLYEWDLNGDGSPDFSDISEFLTVPYSQFVEFGFDDGGTYPISLTVTDPFGGTDTLFGTYDVIANQPPVANIGGPYDLLGPMRELMLDASTSMDPDGDSFQLAYAWDLDNDGLFDDADIDQILAPGPELPNFGIDHAGVYPIAVRVTDVYGKSATASTTLTVANEPPDNVLVMVPPEPANPGDVVSLSADAMDPDDDIALLEVDWDLNLDTVFGDAAGQFVDLTHGELVNLGLNGGSNLIAVRVRDPWGGVAFGFGTITLTENQLPIADPGGPYQLAPITRDLILDGTNSIDPDGEFGFLIYDWDLDDDGEYDDANGDTVTLVLPELLQLGLDKPGQYPVSLRVTDEHGAYGFATTTVDITNEPPVADAGGPYVFEPDPIFENGLMGTAIDNDDEPFNLTFEWDIDLDGIFGDVVGESPLLSFADLSDFGATLPQNKVRLKVTDSFGATDVAEADVAVNYPSPILVDSLLDVVDEFDGLTTLRESVSIANNSPGPIAILLPAGTFDLSIAGLNEDANDTGDLDISDDVILVGAGAGQTVVNALLIDDRVFHIPGSSRVTLIGMTITGGNLTLNDPSLQDDSNGAGILSNGRLTLKDVAVVNNSTSEGWGGGVFTRNSTLEVRRSLIEANNAGFSGGGIGAQQSDLSGITVDASAIVNNTAGNSGGGIVAFGQSLSVTNSTISGNSTTNEPIGIYADFFSEFFGGGGIWSGEGKNLTIDQSTIANNQSAWVGGGIRTTNPASATALRNTIVATNSASEGPDMHGDLQSHGNNLIGIVNPANLSAMATDILGSLAQPLDSGLLPLGDYGGTTPAHGLSADSPAMDAGATSLTTFNDQRGNGFPRVLGAGQDIGAIEVGDDDGVSTAVEDAGPNNGDGNQDGILDSEQANVASLPNSGDGNYVTIVSPASTYVSDATASEIPPDAPIGFDFDLGLLDFTVHRVEVGGSTTVTLFLDPETEVDSYYKFGPTESNPSPHWYEFLFDATSGTGAVIDGTEITIHLKDGARGDDDLTQNGVIVDPGIPGFDRLPGIEFIDPPEFGVVGDELLFTAIVTDPGNSVEPTLSWDFGDGSDAVLDDPFPTHAYFAAGSYAVTLDVTDSFGRVTSRSINVEIDPMPTPEGVADFNDDGQVNALDIDLLFAAIRNGDADPKYDLDGNSQINTLDMDELIHTILDTEYGDADLDGMVSLADLDILGQNYGEIAGWDSGDFNGDQQAGLLDLDILGDNYGFGT